MDKLFGFIGLLLGIACLTMLGMLIISALHEIAFWADISTVYRP